VVVDDPDLVRMSVLPAKTHSVLLVDANAVLTRPIPVQPFEAIPGRHGKFPEFPDPIDLGQFPPDCRPQVDRTGSVCTPAVDTIEQVFRRGIREGPYHGVHYNADRRRTGEPLLGTRSDALTAEVAARDRTPQ
jgi:hypothetical protein